MEGRLRESHLTQRRMSGTFQEGEDPTKFPQQTEMMKTELSKPRQTMTDRDGWRWSATGCDGGRSKTRNVIQEIRGRSNGIGKAVERVRSH